MVLAAASTPIAAAAAKAPFIDWASLGKVAGVSAIFGIAVVVLFSFGIVGLSWYHGVDPNEITPDGLTTLGLAEAGHAPNKSLGLTVAGVCFAICGAAIGFGLWLIIPQFHK